MQSTAEKTNVATAAERQGLVHWAAQKFGVEAGKVFPILKQTCFKGERDKQSGAIKEASDAEVAALMIVAREHGLNPFLKEIYAFPDKRGGIVPVVGVDGWIRIVNEHPAYDGVEFICEKLDAAPAWVECHMFRKDRTHPIKVREFLSECKRDTGPWQSHPARMLRHKTFIQCARVAFGFAGIFDPDEADAIIDGQIIDREPGTNAQQRGAAGLKTALLGDGLNVTAKDDAPAGAKPVGTPALREGDGVPREAALTVIDHIAELEKYNELELMALYADTLADDVKKDDRFTKAFRARSDKIKEAVSVKGCE